MANLAKHLASLGAIERAARITRPHGDGVMKAAAGMRAGLEAQIEQRGRQVSALRTAIAGDDC